MVFGLLGGLIFVSRFGGENSGKAGLGILGMAASLLLIIQAFKMLEKLILPV